MSRIFLISFFMSLFYLSGYSQNLDANSIAKNANNPLASIKSLSVHNIYIPSLYPYDGTMNTTWIRYAQPIGRVLIRASMPINSLNIQDFDRSGLGDFNVFGTYILSAPSSPNQVGIGPIITLPTATSSALGAGKWQAGAALAAYFAGDNTFQAGLLATWQHSFAGAEDRNKVNIGTIQPFFMWQLGKGYYLRSTAITVCDFENGNYLIPLGVGAGKIVKTDNVIFNIFGEPQFTIWHKGSGLAKTQLFIGINTQF